MFWYTEQTRSVFFNKYNCSCQYSLYIPVLTSCFSFLLLSTHMQMIVRIVLKDHKVTTIMKFSFWPLVLIVLLIDEENQLSSSSTVGGNKIQLLCFYTSLIYSVIIKLLLLVHLTYLDLRKQLRLFCMMRELYVTSDIIVPECTDRIKPEHFLFKNF